jgi:hypothetical protein
MGFCCAIRAAGARENPTWGHRRIGCAPTREESDLRPVRTWLSRSRPAQPSPEHRRATPHWPDKPWRQQPGWASPCGVMTNSGMAAIFMETGQALPRPWRSAMTTLAETPPTTGRLRAAWVAAHAAVPDVPRWARIAAYTVPFTALPASLWRIAGVTFHLPISHGEPGSGEVPPWLPMELYVVLLSIFSELVACAALGLIARWGEVFPSWIPGLRGRRVPPVVAIVPAALGAVVLTSMWTLVAVSIASGRDVHGRVLPADFPLGVQDWKGLLAIATYAPLLLWGPLLGALVVAYWWRTRVSN